MKKLLGVLLAIAMSWPASAAVVKGVEVVGEIQTIASDVRASSNTDKVDYNRGAWTRAMAGLSAELVEDVTANVVFQYAYDWGTNNDKLNGFANSGHDVKLVNANVALHNLLCAFDLTVGRQFYGDEDSAVMYFGPNHYNAEVGQYARAFDAAKLVYSDDVKTFTAVAGTMYDSELENENAKYNLFGADFKLNVTNALTAQVYGYDVVATGDEAAAKAVEYIGYDASHRHNGFYGAKLAFAPEAFRASVEAARNYGARRFAKEHNPTGYMVKADLAADIKAVTARGTFLYAKEGFQAFGNYTPGLLVGHKLGGDIWNYTDENGIRLFNLGFDMKPAEKWVVSLDGYTFQSRTGHATTYEADLTVKYNHNEYVQLFAGAGYAKYTKTEGYTDYNSNDIARDNVKGQLGMLVRF